MIFQYARFPVGCNCKLLINLAQYWYEIIELNPECPVHHDLDTLASEPPAE